MDKISTHIRAAMQSFAEATQSRLGFLILLCIGAILFFLEDILKVMAMILSLPIVAIVWIVAAMWVRLRFIGRSILPVLVAIAATVAGLVFYLLYTMEALNHVGLPCQGCTWDERPLIWNVVIYVVIPSLMLLTWIGVLFLCFFPKGKTHA
ncbi:MAG: hypothetical protein AAF429_09390 [Pseudomonadota bacterium]